MTLGKENPTREVSFQLELIFSIWYMMRIWKKPDGYILTTKDSIWEFVIY
jgi:hypothetical protein